MFNAYSHMAYAIGQSDVSTVIVDGRVVVRDRQLKGIEIDPVMDKVRSLVAN
jgi:cytosine/adenosine deaminase-related metal-dependent hydrolase